jgi:hypothetical protein
LGTRQASSPPVAATAAVKEVSDIKVGPPKEVVKARYADDEVGSGDLKKLSLGTPPVTTPRAVSSIRDDEDDDDSPVLPPGGRGKKKCFFTYISLNLIIYRVGENTIVKYKIQLVFCILRANFRKYLYFVFCRMQIYESILYF